MISRTVVFQSDLVFRPFHYFESHGGFFLLSATREQILFFADMNYFQLLSMFVKPTIYDVRDDDEEMNLLCKHLPDAKYQRRFLIEAKLEKFVVFAKDLLVLDRNLTTTPGLDELTSNHWRSVIPGQPQYRQT
jgi:hypothetical protein